MKKEKFDIEYTLRKPSIPILWHSISTPLGLSEWFAEDVTQKDDLYIFSWGDYEQSAYFLEMKPNNFIRFRWEEDLDTEYYFEIRIATEEMSQEVALFVTDFAFADELDDSKLLWDKHIENLRRNTGI